VILEELACQGQHSLPWLGSLAWQWGPLRCFVDFLALADLACIAGRGFKGNG